jgi:hypothetical protein
MYNIATCQVDIQICFYLAEGLLAFFVALATVISPADRLILHPYFIREIALKDYRID